MRHGVSARRSDRRTSRPRSSARAECVSAPTEMTSTPVSAIAPHRVEATRRRTPRPMARPATSSTPARRSSSEKLSSMIVSIPAASTGSIWSSRSTSTSRWVGVRQPRDRAAAARAVTDDARLRRAPRGGCPWPSRRPRASSGGCGRRRRRTACRSNARRPGVVLRVSTMRAPCAGDLGDVARGERGDARHPLHEVEADALGRAARRGPGPRHDGEHGARLERTRRPRRCSSTSIARVGEAERRREDVAAAEARPARARRGRRARSPSRG